jgi:adenine phosphoribosyltransferase
MSKGSAAGAHNTVALARQNALQHFRWLDGDADTWTMLANAESLRAIVAGLAELARADRPDVILGIESRGFVLGPAVAVHLGIGFIPVRKDGALFPGDVVRQETAPDYRGHRRALAARRDLLLPGQRVVLIDDWIETGSQAMASAQIVSACGAELTAIAVIIDETSETSRARLPPIHALVQSHDLA